MAQGSHIEAADSSGSHGGNKDKAGAQATGERFTPLFSRETHTFALMRIDVQDGPRMYSAICLPGWKKA
jgi:hypothetical protein